MKLKLIATCMVVAFLVVGCAGMQIDQKQVIEKSFESAAFMLGNIGAKKNPVAFYAAAMIAEQAMANPLWDLVTAEKTVNDMWTELQPYLSVDQAMMHLAKKWLGIVQYDPETKIISIPEEYIDFVRNCVFEFVLGVQMAGGI